MAAGRISRRRFALLAGTSTGYEMKTPSVATPKQHLAALRYYFDGLVTRHASQSFELVLSVCGERYQGSRSQNTGDHGMRIPNRAPR